VCRDEKQANEVLVNANPGQPNVFNESSAARNAYEVAKPRFSCLDTFAGARSGQAVSGGLKRAGSGPKHLQKVMGSADQLPLIRR